MITDRQYNQSTYNLAKEFLAGICEQIEAWVPEAPDLKHTPGGYDLEAHVHVLKERVKDARGLIELYDKTTGDANWYEHSRALDERAASLSFDWNTAQALASLMHTVIWLKDQVKQIRGEAGGKGRLSTPISYP